MIIGVPKEIKDKEYRVAITPAGVDVLVKAGHKVIVERNAGVGSGISDEEYRKAGAETADTAQEVFKQADMIIKVKEPLPQEYPLLRKNQILFTYLHLAPVPELTKALMKSEIVAVAYETVELENGSLPLLTPMSEVAGKIAVQVGAYYLMRAHGGMGVLLGGVPGVEKRRVVIIGGGVVGTSAAKVAIGLGAKVVIINQTIERLRYLDNIFGDRVETLASNFYNIKKAVVEADLVIGAVLIKGAKAPHLVTREMISKMKKGSVIVDVSIDQGGCVETIKPTSHSDPIYEVDGVIHYGVTNMPGAVPRTSTFALTNATLPYIVKLANLGINALRQDHALAKGVNVFKGKITYKAVAEAIGMDFVPLEKLL
ncbi:MAG: alanine dehydrogenase [Deltaproteobacteria bacterium RIFCSPLOWO2_12_FULL_43_16]|nr:MAG: alanine dehydrogenase [Deltaproteobacteria bacterium GWA2_43_19]OGQ11948.1 MAG: alanine dehydrogenase [Deltaproteobacteria bacterium RIFCSPHIGHO2_02_FULL_43_33]OGQ35580.1 MAG: alanine dehydrogenase [Deltaproteobacteria bacterium RIFCSPLOWO2_01_FULL_42_9]OGQ61442.1 MAG: alanine dehydrogenase [Deltaproteobacteria bacterium RIFCSPLOWO2_12_FULL_43_16]HBR18434.1 alanine dehydrogenase [Deltaproteobacteria bacterium]